MASYFILTLDTTGPEVAIAMPNYTTPEAEVEIWVIGSEQLAPDQDFYIIDSSGNRHGVIFAYEGDRFYGCLNMLGYPSGIARLVVQVYDEVRNPSPVVSHSFNLLTSAKLKVKSLSRQRGVHILEGTRRLRTVNHSISITTEEMTRTLHSSEKIRKIGGGVV